jgi:hypothetical protein
LLSLASSPLGILLPNPLPASSPPALAAAKYPFVALRKSLRLLIDDSPEALDEVENDISFVYSGYAPISIRLVQCVAQKGGVLSNPAEKEKAAIASADGKDQPSQIKAQAHPIAGWRGFEDILATIPGETVDIVQNAPSAVTTPMASLRTSIAVWSVYCILDVDLRQSGRCKSPRRPSYSFWVDARIRRLRPCGGLGGRIGVSFFSFLYVSQRCGAHFLSQGRKFLIATTGIVNGNSIFESISGAPKSVGQKDAAI